MARIERIGEGATVLRGFAIEDAARLFDAVCAIAAVAPFRRMVTPGGFEMSVQMTNCGALGWITDRKGYRYERRDPETGENWPPMPAVFLELGKRASAEAGFAGFLPDSCLINRYEAGTRLSLHQDRNERDFGAPIVSFSLGLAAVFLFGGAERSHRPRRIPLESGDVAIWGGASRLAFHGVAPLSAGVHALTGDCRINLTLRKAL